MARRTFYSFHYKPDNWCAAQVRNMGVIGATVLARIMTGNKSRGAEIKQSRIGLMDNLKVSLARLS